MCESHSPPRVLIAGGAGGVGLACAEAFAACGAELILVDHDGPALSLAAKRLGAFSRYCDGIGSCSIEALVEELTGFVPSIDVLINSVGRGYVRTLAMAQMTRALLPLLRRGTGRRLVINIPSTGGSANRPGFFPYASSLEAFEGLSSMFEEQTRGSGIEVVNFTPRMLPASSPSSRRLTVLTDCTRSMYGTRQNGLSRSPPWRGRAGDWPSRAALIAHSSRGSPFSFGGRPPAGGAEPGSSFVPRRATTAAAKGSSFPIH